MTDTKTNQVKLASRRTKVNESKGGRSGKIKNGSKQKQELKQTNKTVPHKPATTPASNKKPERPGISPEIVEEL